MRKICSRIFKFSTEGLKNTEKSNITSAEQKFTEIPVYLRPYDKAKYEVPLAKIKKNSGYALLQIEPFPRARIMRIGYNILQQVKIGLPQDFLDRIYIEERTKYIMETADKIEDIEELEDFFGVDSIEIFIFEFSKMFQYIEICRKEKYWETQTNGGPQFLKDAIQNENNKFPAYKKGERPISKLIDK